MKNYRLWVISLTMAGLMLPHVVKAQEKIKSEENVVVVEHGGRGPHKAIMKEEVTLVHTPSLSPSTSPSSVPRILCLYWYGETGPASTVLLNTTNS